MLEVKLHHAVQMLPEPTIDFYTIEKMAADQKQEHTYKSGSYRKIALVLTVILLLCCTVTAAVTDVHYSAWATNSVSFRDVQSVGRKLSITIPESLDDSPFYNITTMHVVPEGTTYLEAIVTPVYRWYEIDYGVQEIVGEYHSDETGSGYSQTTQTYDEFSLCVGSTEDELWKYCFGLDEDGVWMPDTSVVEYTTEQYNGITLQIGTTVTYDMQNSNEILGYRHRIVWVDTGNRAVFILRKYLPNMPDAQKMPAELPDFAKKIIDMNCIA